MERREERYTFERRDIKTMDPQLCWNFFIFLTPLRLIHTEKIEKNNIFSA